MFGFQPQLFGNIDRGYTTEYYFSEIFLDNRMKKNLNPFLNFNLRVIRVDI